MNRYVDLTFRDKRARLYFSMNVMLDATEEYDMTVPDLLKGTEREVFERECWLASRMSIEGKMVWNTLDFESLSLSELGNVTPGEMTYIANAVIEAINLGYKTEIQPEIVDETLVELKKNRNKKGSKGQKQ